MTTIGRVVAERRARWRFLHENGGWRWLVVKPDGRIERAAGLFNSLVSCYDAAKAHGCRFWLGPDRRKRKVSLALQR